MEDELSSLLTIFSDLEAREAKVEKERIMVVKRTSCVREKVSAIRKNIARSRRAKDTLTAETRTLHSDVARLNMEALGLEQVQRALTESISEARVREHSERNQSLSIANRSLQIACSTLRLPAVRQAFERDLHFVTQSIATKFDYEESFKRCQAARDVLISAQANRNEAQSCLVHERQSLTDAEERLEVYK